MKVTWNGVLAVEVMRGGQILVCFEGSIHSQLLLGQMWAMKERDTSSITQYFMYRYLLNTYYGPAIVLCVWIYQ